MTKDIENIQIREKRNGDVLFRDLKQKRTEILLGLTSNIKDKHERDLAMMKLAASRKYSISGLARSILVKSIDSVDAESLM
jgi:hypothetical protein